MVPIQTMGSGSATAANLVIFAMATFSLIIQWIAKLKKMLRRAPYLREGRGPDIAAVQLQIAAGLHLPGMADKTEARAAKTASGQGIHTKDLGRDRYALFFGPLPHDAVVVGRTGGFEVHLGGFAEIIEPVERFFVLTGGDYLIRQT